MGVAPTRRDVAFTVVTLSRCRDGKIEEEWELADTAGLLRQIGAFPAPVEA
jgi:predicted ester cyclase